MQALHTQVSNRPPNPAKNPGGSPIARSPNPRPPHRTAPPPPPPNNLPRYLMGGLLGVIVLAMLVLNNNSTTATSTLAVNTPATGTLDAPVANNAKSDATSDGTKGAIALVETSKGNFKIQLFSDPATQGTVKNFTDRVESGYFNGKIFHRVEDWVIQGGDPLGTGTGGGDIPGEYTSHSFVRGVVGMASTAPHAAKVNDSQWFVVKKDSTFLDNKYDVFGQVIAGMDVVERISIGDAMSKITMQP